MKKTLFFLLASLILSLPLSAKDEKEEWHPVASWPFLYKNFSQAVITTTAGQVVKGNANMHVGSHNLWYENAARQKMAAKEGTIAKVRFPNGDIYMPVGNKLCKVVRTDTIDNKVCHVLRSDEVDQERYNELTRINNMSMMALGSGFANLDNTFNSVAENEGTNNLDREPLPMKTFFFMIYNGDTFPANESNILKHLDKAERSAYRAFTRRAEIIYSNESSIMRVWDTFFKK